MHVLGDGLGHNSHGMRRLEFRYLKGTASVYLVCRRHPRFPSSDAKREYLTVPLVYETAGHAVQRRNALVAFRSHAMAKLALEHALPASSPRQRLKRSHRLYLMHTTNEVAGNIAAELRMPYIAILYDLNDDAETNDVFYKHR